MRKLELLKNLINNHPDAPHPIAISLKSNDCTTDSGIPHRELTNTNKDVFIEYMIPVLKKHHISPEVYEKRKAFISSFNIPNLSSCSKSLYPRNSKTQKGNFAEIFLADYLQLTTDAQLPVYKLRHNPNVDQSMKGDDVLLFDLDSTPVRIIVGEAKFRETPTKNAVIEIVNSLIGSNKLGLPALLDFVANKLFEDNNDELAKKVLECSFLFTQDKLTIDYVGLLMSDLNARNHVNKHTGNELRNLLMISLGTNNPSTIIEQTFQQVEFA